MTVALHDLLPAGLRRTWAVDGTCPDLDLYSLFRARQIADLHATAVIDAKGKLCYTALDRKVRCLATGLAGLGIRPGDVVGVQLPGGRNAVIAELALAAVGAVALPFPVGRGSLEAEALLRRAEAVAVIAAVEHRGDHHAAELRALVGSLPALRHVIAAGRPGTAPEGTILFSELLRSDPAAFVPARPDPDSAARILVSSGSEAEPKMVAYSTTRSPEAGATSWPRSCPTRLRRAPCSSYRSGPRSGPTARPSPSPGTAEHWSCSITSPPKPPSPPCASTGPPTSWASPRWSA